MNCFRLTLMRGVRQRDDAAAFVWVFLFLFQSGVHTDRSELAAVVGQKTVSSEPSSSTPTFYQNVLPILAKHCQRCHNASGIAPMPFETYDQVRGYANVIRNVAEDKAMPPPFAIPEAGRVREDPSLTQEEIATIAAWANAKAPPGEPAKVAHSAQIGESAPTPEIVKLQKTVSPPPRDGDCIYEIVPTHFKEDRWVQMAEFLSGQIQDVRQAVIFIRPPGSSWLRHFPFGEPFAEAKLDRTERNHLTKEEILVVYSAGSPPAKWPGPTAKLIPAGADLVFRLQYVAGEKIRADLSGIALTFSPHPPVQRVITLQLTKDHFIVPAGASNFSTKVRGILSTNALLLGFFPDMRRLGTRFEYDIVHSNGNVNESSIQNEVLLRVNFDLRWQGSYSLIEPRRLKAGAKLQAVAWYDSSANNVRNLNSSVPVYPGDKYGTKASAGFFEVAIPTGLANRKPLLR